MSATPLIHPLDAQLRVLDVLDRFAGEDFLLLLDSAAHVRARDARYTFLTADPVDIVELDQCRHGDDPFATLRAWQTRLPANVPSSAPTFCGGIAGMLSYELGQAFERLPVAQRSDGEVPVLVAGLFDWAIVWDHIEGSVTVWVLPLGDDKSAAQRLDWVLTRLKGRGPNSRVRFENETFAPAPTGHMLHSSTDVRSSFTRDAYLSAVERVIEYIRAGDIFQANLSQQLTAPWSGSAVELYHRVRQHNAAPFCGLLQRRDFAVVSASPERFLKVVGGVSVETRPIKGTRRRHRSPIADLFTGDTLIASEKDRAENVMIVDLLRNDLSRVCRPGSVRVTGICEIEVFETVQHLVSTVVGELKAGKTIWNLLAACFPGGSITGAPKIRAMEIITELEQAARGAYCGSLFCCGPNGDFDSSILIRTFTLKDGRVRFPVGGGIVADSNASDEYEETLHKASGMLRVLAGA